MEPRLGGARVSAAGGGTRLGRAIGQGVGQAGAEVAVHFFHSEAGAESVVTELTESGGRAAKFKADLMQPIQVADLVEQVETQFGPLTGLVNSAAIFERSPFLETSVASLRRQWELNAQSPFLFPQPPAARMPGRTGGDVVNVLDIGGALVPWRNYSAVCLSKAAMAMLTPCLGIELAPKIQVNSVAPGTVLPPESSSSGELDQLRRHIPHQRFATPQEVVDAVLFLLGGPRFITGQILAVDGGRSLSSAGA